MCDKDHRQFLPRNSCKSSSLSFVRVISSSAANGLSISRIFGQVTSARAIDTRIFMPPDSCRGYESQTPIARRALKPLDAPRASRLFTPASKSGRQTLSAAVRHGNSVGSWDKAERWLRRACRAVGRLRPVNHARRWRRQPGNHLKQCRFSAARRAEQTDELSGRIVRSAPASAIVPLLKVFEMSSRRRSGRDVGPDAAVRIVAGSAMAMMGTTVAMLRLNVAAARNFASYPD